MIQVEFTDEEAEAVLHCLGEMQNPTIAAGDPQGRLEHMESAEEKITGTLDDASIALARVPTASGLM